MAAKKLSRTQIDVLRHMKAEGKIHREPGGFWITSMTKPLGPFWEWSVPTNTVMAMDRAGLIERCHTFVESWRSSRQLSTTGLAAAAALEPA